MSFLKDPEAVLDYAWDWTAWLVAAETISTATITVPTGITKNSQSIAAGVVTAWMAGGAAGTRYGLICRIVTNQGRTDDRTLYIDVKQR